MGSNIIQLADHMVPSYRRLRPDRSCQPAAPARPGAWSAMARERGAEKRLAAASGPGVAAAPRRVVRVTQLADRCDAPASGARLRISGRLIDVCAELERLAAAEAAALLPRRA